MAKQSKQLKGFTLPKPVIGKGKPTNPVLLTEEDKRRSLEKMKERLRFSLHYLDLKHEAFNCGGVKYSWYLSLFETFYEVSKLSFQELKNQRQHYDAHQHNWSKLDYKYALPEHLWEQVQDSCWQFRLSKSRGRVHGFVIGNTFYVVWLDPHHNLYPDERYGGRKIFETPMNEYDLLLKELDEAKKQVAAYEQMLDEMTKPNT